MTTLLYRYGAMIESITIGSSPSWDALECEAPAEPLGGSQDAAQQELRAPGLLCSTPRGRSGLG